MRLGHHMVATAQVGLSYLIVGSYVGIVAAEGMGRLSTGTASSMKDVLFLVATFWFQRQRTSEPPPPSSSPPETKTP